MNDPRTVDPTVGNLLDSLAHAGVAVLRQDRDLRILWSHNLPAAWNGRPQHPETDADLFADEEAARLCAIKRKVLDTGVPAHTEVHVHASAGTEWHDLWIDPTRNGEGAIDGLLTTAVETTEHRRREQTLRALLREVSHRSKNLLAVIQSIATQTGRHSDTISRFLLRFQGRIQSLASSQDLVTSSNWRGAMLHELVRNQAVRYCEAPEICIRIIGSDVRLAPNAALHIGLALHELVVNSVSFGALAAPEGHVVVESRYDRKADKGHGLVLEWIEQAAIEEADIDRARFGSVALTRVVPAAIDGEATLTIDPKGIRYRLFVPAANME